MELVFVMTWCGREDPDAELQTKLDLLQKQKHKAQLSRIP